MEDIHGSPSKVGFVAHKQEGCQLLFLPHKNLRGCTGWLDTNAFQSDPAAVEWRVCGGKTKFVLLAHSVACVARIYLFEVNTHNDTTVLHW